MLIKIGDTIYDPNKVPCAIIFKNDEEKNHIENIIRNMPHKENVERWFAMSPKDFFNEGSFDKWAELTEDDKNLIKQWRKPVKIQL